MATHQPNGRLIITHFEVAGEVVELHPYGSGHIQNTFKVHCSTPTGDSTYLLQQINTYVFPQPTHLIHNLLRVNQQLRAKGYSKRLLEPIPTRHNTYLHQDAAGHYWRLFPFFENTYSPNQVDSPQLAYVGAKAYGAFLSGISDMDLGGMHLILPDFHNGQRRWAAFEEALATATAERKKLASVILSQLQQLSGIIGRIRWADLPSRIIHNDTKIANLLFDQETQEAVAVVDLDTLMPGSVLYDFGDMCRTFCCSRGEEEQNMAVVNFRLDLFEGLLRGFMEEMDGVLTAVERHHMFNGICWVVYVQALRFASDFLSGDKYYKTQYPLQNLRRAENQMAVLTSILEQRVAIEGRLKRGSTKK